MFRTPLLTKISKLIRVAHTLNVNPTLNISQIEERRRFLKSSFITVASLLPLSSVLSSCAYTVLSTPSRQPSTGKNFLKKIDEHPVVIIGAGIAGLTAAYELTKAGCPCVIYEASPRLGGRMFTKLNFNDEAMTCELGGELLDTSHDDLLALCKELGVEVDDFITEDHDLEQNLYYFGGKHFTDRELIERFQPFAKRLAKDQQQAFPESVPEGTVTAYAKKLDRLTLDEYLAGFTDVDKWIVDLIRVAYVGEMALDSSVQSATGMISTLAAETKQGFKIYGESDQAKKIRGGNVRLIEALCNYLQTANVKIHLSAPLQAVAQTGSGLRLQFNDSIHSNFVAKRVVCTLPFSVLRNIDGLFTLPLHPLKKSCIARTTYGTAAKLMLGYNSRPWRNGMKDGNKIIPPSNGMVYTDLAAQNIWDSSRTQRGKAGILTCYVGGKAGAQLGLQQLAPFRKNVDLIFPRLDSLFDANSAHFNWTQYQYSLGSYAASKPGESYMFGDIAGKSELSGQLHFAGEHTSGKYSGFMNGACRSGKLAAHELLKSLAGSMSLKRTQ